MGKVILTVFTPTEAYANSTSNLTMAKGSVIVDVPDYIFHLTLHRPPVVIRIINNYVQISQTFFDGSTFSTQIANGDIINIEELKALFTSIALLA